MSNFNEFTEQTNEAISSAKGELTRARRHSTCSYVPRHAKPLTPEIAKDASPNYAPRSTQGVSSTANAVFVGLPRRRKSSLPSAVVLKRDQFLEGGRVEVSKREVNLEAHMPVFVKEPGAARKGSTTVSTTALTKTEVNGWMFANNGGKMSANQGPRQRRISLPVLRVDKTDSPALPSCKSTSSGELNNNFLTPIPRVRSGSLASKKAENRQWTQGN